MVHEISHLCWDFDGTLYSTYTQMVRSTLYALDDLGFYVPPAETYALLKRSVYHACQTLARRFDVPADRMMEAFLRHHQAETGWAYYAEADVCLYQLKRSGCKHYLYTHRDRKAVRQLAMDDLAGYFTDFITRDDGFPDKPAPDALQHLCAKHGFDPKTAVMIGDRDIDIQAGHNAGMRGILFDPDGFYPDLDVEYRMTTMAELCSLVKSSRL